MNLKFFWPLLLAASPLFAHKFHTSLTTVEWNETAQSLEVVMQLFSDDLKVAASKLAGWEVSLSRKHESAIFDYVEKKFIVLDKSGDPLNLTWVGMEMDVSRVWVYVEVPLANGLDELSLEQSVFLEMFDDQVNTVNIHIGKARHTLIFKGERGAQPLLAEP